MFLGPVPLMIPVRSHTSRNRKAHGHGKDKAKKSMSSCDVP